DSGPHESSAGPAALTVPSALPIPADGAPGLYLRASLAPNIEPLGWPLNWTVSVDGQRNAILFSGRAASPHAAAAPGRYLIEAHEGAVSASRSVEAQATAPTLVDLVLNAGLLRVRALVEKVGAPLADAIITIAEAPQGSEVKKNSQMGVLIGVYKGSEALALLPAGRYLVRVEQGLLRAERSVVVPAGSQGRLDIALNAARLQVSAVGRDGAGA